MAKFKVITRSLDPQKFELYEEVIDCDNVMLDQTGKFMIFAEASRLEAALAPQPGGATPMSVKFIKWINSDVIVECFDVNRLSKLHQA